MSARDEKTMRAWAFSFGKPMLCAIQVMGRQTRMIRGDTEFESANDRQAMSADVGEAVLRSWLVYPAGDIVQCPKTVIFKDSWIIAVLDQGV
jgi:hypothetical protein